jgi:hypothetical protein
MEKLSTVCRRFGTPVSAWAFHSAAPPLQLSEKQLEFQSIHSFVENPVGNSPLLNSHACQQGHRQPFA